MIMYCYIYVILEQYKRFVHYIKGTVKDKIKCKILANILILVDL